MGMRSSGRLRKSRPLSRFRMFRRLGRVPLVKSLLMHGKRFELLGQVPWHIGVSLPLADAQKRFDSLGIELTSEDSSFRAQLQQRTDRWRRFAVLVELTSEDSSFRSQMKQRTDHWRRFTVLVLLSSSRTDR